jgi:hypothetical protein
MIRPEIQWIADDAANTANFKRRGDDFQHVKTKLVLDAYGRLSILCIFGSRMLAMTSEEMELLKTARLRLYNAMSQEHERAQMEKSTATLKKFYGIDQKDYRLVQDKTKDV